ncbi:MAG TPA: hypothetical protein VHY08_20810 [Bacillota bacterium]|nr:hypothetical protein [Bacillota bacterium]
MGRAKHDWEKLKMQYVTGDYLDQHIFADSVGINYSYLRNQSCRMKWEEARKAYLAQRDKLIEQKTLEKQAELEADHNIRHLEAWDDFLRELTKVMATYSVTVPNGVLTIFALERLANVMEKLQKGQRLCLGMDKEARESGEGSLAELTQAIRESYTPKTEVNNNDHMG